MRTLGWIACAALGCAHRAPAAAPPQPAIFELGEITLFDGDEVAYKIHADGSTEMGYRSGANIQLEPGKTWSSNSLPLRLRAGPTMKVDGTFWWKGEAVMRVNADGTIVALASKQALPGVTLTAERLVIGGHGTPLAFEVAANGAVTQVGGNVATKPLRMEGADTPGKRRAMLGMLALVVARDPGEPDVRVVPTPIGATVVTWKLADSDRVTIRDATLTRKTARTIEHVAHPSSDTSIRLAIELETATAVFREGGEEVTHDAPIKLAARVVENDGFLLDRPRCWGPHYQKGGMVLQCTVHATKPRYNVLFTLIARGDGVLHSE